MKTGNAKPVKHTGGGGFGPVGGGGFGPVGGGGFGPVGGGGPHNTPDGGGGPIGGWRAGGGPRSKAILERIATHLAELSKAFDDLANTPIGGVPSEKGTVKKK